MQKEQDKQNEESKKRQGASLASRRENREARDMMRSELKLANSTGERREIKARYAKMPEIAPPKIDLTEVEANYEGTGYNLGIMEGGETGGGLPEGYVETDVILCVNGSPVNGQILFKEDTP